jgi:error-prone DNA polymerase
MVTPFLMARQGWQEINYLHEDLEPVLDETGGVVVFHEQVLQIIHVLTGCSLAEADEARRALGDPAGQPEVRAWFIPAALGNGYDVDTVLRVWEVLKAFASFGFCKAHAAAFAVPTYQSAWLKAHYPAAFMAGVLTHDPGMYPKRLILDDARQFGIAVLPLDVNRSDASYRVERVGIYDEPPPVILDQAAPRARPDDLRLPDGRAYGIRLALADVKGITDAEIASIVAGRPFATLSDFWQRAAVSRPVAERLVLAGAFDELYGIGGALPIRRRGQLTRRDLLLQLAQLHAWTKSARPLANPVRPAALPASSRELAASAETRLASPSHGQPTGIRAATARQSQAPAAAPNAHSLAVQLTFDLAEATGEVENSGLPELTRAERVRAELEILGLDASEHVMAVYEPFLAALGVTRARDLLRCRSRQEVLTAGVKVATQTPPVRSGKRVVFVTLDDATGPVDATFFEDAQVGYASTLFHSWLLVIRGLVRRTGPRGVSMQATGCWELPVLRDAWEAGGLPAVHAAMDAPGLISDAAVHGAAESRSTRPVMVAPPVGHPPLIYASGFRLSPYSDIKPAGQPAARSPRKLWHASPGSSGR